MDKKFCNKCKTEKDISEFSKRSDRPLGVQSGCKECHKQLNKDWLSKNRVRRQNDWLQFRYGISLEERNTKLSLQKGQCAICLKPFGEFSRPNVDHNHETGQVRGLLCQNCNAGLGMFQDSSKLLELASAYLRFHNE